MLVVHRQDGGAPQSAGQQKNWVLEFCDGSHARRAIPLNLIMVPPLRRLTRKFLRAGETLIRPEPLLLLFKKGVHYAFDYCRGFGRDCSFDDRRTAGKCGGLDMPRSGLRLWGARFTSDGHGRPRSPGSRTGLRKLRLLIARIGAITPRLPPEPASPIGSPLPAAAIAARLPTTGKANRLPRAPGSTLAP